MFPVLSNIISGQCCYYSRTRGRRTSTYKTNEVTQNEEHVVYIYLNSAQMICMEPILSAKYVESFGAEKEIRLEDD